MSSPQVRRGEIYWVDWNPGRGSEQIGHRPALIVQTDAGNANPNYPNTIVAAITITPARVLTHVEIRPYPSAGLREVSCVRCEQICTIDKSRLSGRVGELSEEDMGRVTIALRLALGMAQV